MLKLRNHNIILPKYLEIVNKKGSPLIFFAQGGWGKKKNELPRSKLRGNLFNYKLAAKIFHRRSEGAAEGGGVGGNSAAPERWSPAAPLIQSRSQQKSFLFLLEEKIRCAQKKSRENFFAGWRAVASGGGAILSNDEVSIGGEGGI